jgi:hypothetical protein
MNLKIPALALLTGAAIAGASPAAQATNTTTLTETPAAPSKLTQLAQRPYDPSAGSVGFRPYDPSAGSVGFRNENPGGVGYKKSPKKKAKKKK